MKIFAIFILFAGALALVYSELIYLNISEKDYVPYAKFTLDVPSELTFTALCANALDRSDLKQNEEYKRYAKISAKDYVSYADLNQIGVDGGSPDDCDAFRATHLGCIPENATQIGCGYNSDYGFRIVCVYN